jgi:glycosyltransferase involved in cell wall biosynthesis
LKRHDSDRASGAVIVPEATVPGVIALDLSRLLSRAGRSTPTGIDRVELAYAEHMIAGGTSGVFAALTPDGRLASLPRRIAEEFVREIGAAWRGPPDPGAQERRVRRIARHARLALLAGSERLLFGMLRDRAGSVYLLVSHHHLEQRKLIARVKKRSRARFVCLIHDLIPVEFPEYAKPGQAANHLRRIETAAEFADAVIVNSAATGAALQPHLDRAGRTPPVLMALFGADLAAIAGMAGAAPVGRPYFVYLGTIEARKNHLMLLNLWRRLSHDLGERAPALVLVGQRGWEVENVVDMLDRCPALRDTVIEYNTMPDAAMVGLLRGARALLLPSFAEGFGFPVIEALQLGVPALCSDIAALRETGGAVPEFLDPLDGAGWHRAILDYAAPDSPRRAAQLARLAAWRPPRWDAYFAAVDRFIAELPQSLIGSDNPI